MFIKHMALACLSFSLWITASEPHVPAIQVLLGIAAAVELNAAPVAQQKKAPKAYGQPKKHGASVYVKQAHTKNKYRSIKR